MIIKIVEQRTPYSLSGIEISGISVTLQEIIKHIIDHNIRLYNQNVFILDFFRYYRDDLTIRSFLENSTNIINQEMIILDFQNKKMHIYDLSKYPSHNIIQLSDKKNINKSLKDYIENI